MTTTTSASTSASNVSTVTVGNHNLKEGVLYKWVQDSYTGEIFPVAVEIETYDKDTTLEILVAEESAQSIADKWVDSFYTR